MDVHVRIYIYDGHADEENAEVTEYDCESVEVSETRMMMRSLSHDSYHSLKLVHCGRGRDGDGESSGETTGRDCGGTRAARSERSHSLDGMAMAPD